MSDTEQCLVVELLNVLVCLDPHSSDVTSELLSLLADKRLRLQGVVVCMLQAVGLDDVQRWLGPQLESWYSTAQKHMDPQSHLREAVRNWLHIWTSKYKMHKRSGEKSVISAAEVVRYFCQVQAKPPAPPPDRKETGLMDPKSNRWKMLQRLNETNSMTPTREPRALWLPPLASRPLLMGFTRALSLPMPRVTTSSFPFTLEVHCLRRTPLQQRYFHLERSYVHYYR
ncbi:WD repeat-containing protein 97 [Trichomycterus rosablanca]|uniref:WD repeat-containing protein 97 n=1 Tax=Trichomycterus rosablanca TaxID=2290929 RepID=UPI002F35F477